MSDHAQKLIVSKIVALKSAAYFALLDVFIMFYLYFATLPEIYNLSQLLILYRSFPIEHNVIFAVTTTAALNPLEIFNEFN